MIIRCCDCERYRPNADDYIGQWKCILSGSTSKVEKPEEFTVCNMADYCDTQRAYRYSLADKLYRAVLERLLDQKNVAKGEFEGTLRELHYEAGIEMSELEEAMNNTGDNYVQRVIEEAGDVGAYIAAIIDVVRS